LVFILGEASRPDLLGQTCIRRALQAAVPAMTVFFKNRGFPKAIAGVFLSSGGHNPVIIIPKQVRSIWKSYYITAF
jgi:hypothetical protein